MEPQATVKELIDATWTYTCQDGTQIPMRAMDTREREFFNGGPFAAVYSSWSSMTYKQYKPSAAWEACYEEALNFAGKLSSVNGVQFVLSNFGKQEFVEDLLGFLRELLEKEGYIRLVPAGGSDSQAVVIPSDPAAVDLLSVEEAERLGESLGQIVQPQTTTPTTPAGATS